MNSDPDSLERLLFSYPQVGLTEALASSSDVDRPASYRLIDGTWAVGRGQTAFRLASECLMTLTMHRQAGVKVTPDVMRVTEGVSFQLRLGIGAAAFKAPCRVVYIVDSDTMSAFAYGTLEGHPERGEARFEVSLSEVDGSTLFRILSFSQAATRLARIGGPFTRWAQDAVNQRYRRSLESAAITETSGDS